MNSETITEAENAALRAAGWTDGDVPLMPPKQRVAELKEAADYECLMTSATLSKQFMSTTTWAHTITFCGRLKLL
jgi:hypothetical protein